MTGTHWKKIALRPEIQKLMRPRTGGLRIAIDCALDAQPERTSPMTQVELSSLAKQLVLSHSSNFKAIRPCHLHLVGLSPQGPVDTAFQREIPFYESMLVTKTEDPVDVYFHDSDIVYLSPYSEQELESVECSSVYVLGGVVDRSIDKGLSESYAKRVGLRTAQLPIRKHIKVKHHTQLPINIVLDVLLAVYNGDSWTQALIKHIPTRKNVTVL